MNAGLLGALGGAGMAVADIGDKRMREKQLESVRDADSVREMNKLKAVNAMQIARDKTVHDYGQEDIRLTAKLAKPTAQYDFEKVTNSDGSESLVKVHRVSGEVSPATMGGEAPTTDRLLAALQGQKAGAAKPGTAGPAPAQNAAAEKTQATDGGLIPKILGDEPTLPAAKPVTATTNRAAEQRATAAANKEANSAKRAAQLKSDIEAARPILKNNEFLNPANIATMPADQKNQLREAIAVMANNGTEEEKALALRLDQLLRVSNNPYGSPR